MVCKHCGGVNSVKSGFLSGKQRYKCKDCKKTYGEGDDRVKYSSEKKLKVLKMYLEGVGIRSIERLEGVDNPLIIYWIRTFSDILRKRLNEAADSSSSIKGIEILEVDELVTHVKKKRLKSGYGLLLIENETKLLTWK